LPLPRPLRRRADDPYWESFLNTPFADPNNNINRTIRAMPPGGVFPVPSEIHSPEVMSAHVKELGRFFGAVATGIVRLSGEEADPFAIVCAVRAEHDPRDAPGPGGQAPVSQSLFVTFNIAAVIREWGRRAFIAPELDGDRLAAAAGLGLLSRDGRLVLPRHGSKVFVGDVVRTALPLAPDGTATAPARA